ncbi:MAG: transcription antiterminator [Anaerolineae bacterium]|nr:transcription antiterminator [Anaerolineae bacterium]
MTTLTLQQKRLLHLLLNADDPVSASELAEQTNLSPRQVTYRLKPVKSWLTEHDIRLKSVPGVGMTLDCSVDQRQNLLRNLDNQSDFQVVLTAGQRQQLFALVLLSMSEPLILNWLQHTAAVSRTTVLKDLDIIEPWAKEFGLELIRKPNYGIEFRGSESARRQALAALAWGDTPFEDDLLQMAFGTGLTFAFKDNTSLPIIERAIQILNQWDTQTAFEWVAYAEAQLGGRFTDNAALHLALALAIQTQRAKNGFYFNCAPDTLAWLQAQKVWGVAYEVGQLMWPDDARGLVNAEVAAIAMHLLSGLRHHLWLRDLEIDPTLTNLIELLMAEVAMAFSTPGLRHDTPLRDGLVAHIIPSFMRQRFGLWTPPTWPAEQLPPRYKREYYIANELAKIVTKHTGVVLPDDEIATLAALLRAAFIREGTSQPKRVFIICPSGLATSQLLAARLKARFPSLDIRGVLSIRELTLERVASAQLLISTVPVQSPRSTLDVIKVHPLLLPEDIDAITHWLS